MDQLAGNLTIAIIAGVILLIALRTRQRRQVPCRNSGDGVPLPILHAGVRAMICHEVPDYEAWAEEQYLKINLGYRWNVYRPWVARTFNTYGPAYQRATTETRQQ